MALKDESSIRDLSLASQMLWSNVSKIREILGKDVILTRSGDIDGDPCFIIALPVSRWQLDGKTPLPKELFETETGPALAIPDDRGSVGNLEAAPLAISPAPVGNSEEPDPAALAIPEEEE